MSVKLIREALGHHVETLGRAKDGTVIVRRSFFYTSGGSAEKFASIVTGRLQQANVAAKVIDQGEVWKPFRGGATVANSSHWWAKIELTS